VRRVNCRAGPLRPVAKRRFAAGPLEQAPIKLLPESINAFDIRGFYLNWTQQAIDLLDEVGSDNLYSQ
jgi:hydroxypyruvate isomerase